MNSSNELVPITSVENQEFYARGDRAKKNSKEIAIVEALKIKLNISHVVSDPIPSVFGNRWESSFDRTRMQLIESYGEKFHGLITLAALHFEFSRWRDATFMRLLAPDQPPEGYLMMTTPDGYADHEGWASTASNGLADLCQPIELLADLPFDEYPPADHILEADALIWFFEAAQVHARDESSAMNILFEAADAMILANGFLMWAESEKLQREEGDKLSAITRTSGAASCMAKRRHAENYAMSKDALKYWREKIDPNISASKAANELLRVVPLSHKKLAEIVAAEKKRQS
jgi:hypothetical protein